MTGKFLPGLWPIDGEGGDSVKTKGGLTELPFPPPGTLVMPARPLLDNQAGSIHICRNGVRDQPSFVMSWHGAVPQGGSGQPNLCVCVCVCVCFSG